MRRTLCRRAKAAHHKTTIDSPPLISIKNATFYRQHPSSLPKKTENDSHDSNPIDTNPPLFPGLNFTIPSFSEPKQHWSILSKNSSVRTTFLQILRGQHICLPPTARSYPYLATDAIANKDSRLRSPSHAIQYVGFDAERGSAGAMRGAYMSARYESRKEETDFSLRDYLFGNTELNADETLARHPDQSLVDQIMLHLKLETLESMPVTNLSNGQTRRARIAKALLAKPELLLLDGPFMGLDPPTVTMLVNILHRLADSHSPRLVLSLRPDEEYPAWITHTAYLNGNYTVHSSGPRMETIKNIHQRAKTVVKGVNIKELTKEDLDVITVSISLRANEPLPESRMSIGEHKLYQRTRTHGTKDAGDNRALVSRDGFSAEPKPLPPPGEPLIEMKGVNVKYDGKSVLGDWKQQVDGETRDGLWWSVHRGQRWGVFGPNGSGKTTLISLITSDHPQTYSLPITIFGRSRLPQPGQPGISIFDIQSRIGHSSPEVHTFFPKFLTVRRTIESAWADTPLTRPKSTYEIDAKVTAALAWFQGELNPSLGPTKAETFDQTERLYQKNQQVGQLQEMTNLLDDHDAEGGGDAWADHLKFAEMSFSAQRVALFIRAVIRNPDLVVLDEAFSGMDDAARDKCILFLSKGESASFRFKQTNNTGTALVRKPSIQESFHSRLGRVTIEGLQDHQALIVISHKKEEVPGCVRNWICLAQSGQGAPRTGELSAPLELTVGGWNDIWGARILPMRVAKYEGLYRPTRVAYKKYKDGEIGSAPATEQKTKASKKTKEQKLEKRKNGEELQRKRLKKALDDGPCQASEEMKRKEKLIRMRAISQKWRDSLTAEKRERVLEQARIRAQNRRQRLEKARDDKTNACKERLETAIEVANSANDTETTKLLEKELATLNRKVKKGPFTAEEVLERKRESARRCRAAAQLRKQEKLDLQIQQRQGLTRAEWLAAGRPGETDRQREKRLKHNELAKQFMRRTRGEQRRLKREQKQKEEEGKKTKETMTE
ncbi:hypothetical protein EG328_011716 [Venturia inaequalis]|uniref:ABC transporter domain-containing protein n=1 Tax=Venturia inaequalis TaxID=5025 RepID=A0A8H3V5A8_VENIN|nr:hypothetical protein EG328_011716 [Venturia inaequalis]